MTWQGSDIAEVTFDILNLTGQNLGLEVAYVCIQEGRKKMSLAPFYIYIHV